MRTHATGDGRDVSNRRWRAAFSGVPCKMVATLLVWGCVRVSEGYAACDPDAPPGRSAGVESHGDFHVDAPTPYRVAASSTRLDWRGDAWRFDYDYLALDFPAQSPDTPVTNGDLHALALGYRGRVKLKQAGLHWEIAPTLAVSSNLLQHPERIEAGSMRVDGGVLWQRETDAAVSWVAGGCMTALTGEHQPIPVVGVTYRRGRWLFAPGYPRAVMRWRATPRLALYSDWQLAGNQWQVLDKALAKRSDFTVEAQQLRAGIQVGLPGAGHVDVYWSHRSHQRLDYLANDGARLSAAVTDGDGWMLRYVWQ